MSSNKTIINAYHGRDANVASALYSKLLSMAMDGRPLKTENPDEFIEISDVKIFQDPDMTHRVSIHGERKRAVYR